MRKASLRTWDAGWELKCGRDSVVRGDYHRRYIRGYRNDAMNRQLR